MNKPEQQVKPKLKPSEHLARKLLSPCTSEIQQVMRETGMDYVQAYRHVVGRNILRSM